MRKKKIEVWAPQFGCWSETASVEPPPACQILGLFLREGPNIAMHMGVPRLCNAYYFLKGKRVDPDESKYETIRWFVTGADGQEQEVSPPYAWAEARWVVPLGAAWDKAHGLKKGGK